VKTLPCWIVDVRHERNSGRLGHFRSRPMSWTDARRLLAQYEATGTPAKLECIEELAALHRLMIQKQLTYNQALREALHLGYELERNP
jgi:hypothetical protein